ncbi:MAG: hypothetical protein WEB87_03345, partial [Bacteriovoracaceae bacterium]
VSFFVFRKRLVEQIINSHISFELISSARAQTAPLGDAYKEIKRGASSLIPRPGIMGFQLTGEVGDLPEDCSELLDPFFMSAFIFADISDENYFIKMNECLKKERQTKSWVLRHGAVGFPLSSKEKKFIDQVRKKLADREKLWALIQGDLLETDFTKDSSLTKLSKVLKSLERWDSAPSTVAKIFIYAHLGNEGRVDSLAKKYLVRNRFQLFYDLEFPYHQAEGVQNRLVSMLKSVSEKLGKNKIFQAFLFKLYNESSLSMKKSLNQNIRIAFSEKEIAPFYDSPVLGGSFPLAWTKWAGENMSQKQLNALFDKIEISSTPEHLYIYRYFYPATSEQKLSAANRIVRLANSSNPLHKNLYFEILKNKDWGKHFSSRQNKDLKPFFRDKRDFYKNNAHQNLALLFSIYNLFKLGDFEREYFLKLLAIGSYGLPATEILPL